MAITLNTAQAMIERSRAHATSIDAPMNIAVTDGGACPAAYECERRASVRDDAGRDVRRR
jgi:hypothetical protein